MLLRVIQLFTATWIYRGSFDPLTLVLFPQKRRKLWVLFIVYSFYFVLGGGADHWTEHVFSKVGGVYEGQEGKQFGIGETSRWRPPGAKESQVLFGNSALLLMARE